MSHDHTPLPWDVATDGRVYAYADQRTPSPFITFRTNTILAEGLAPGNARRILACVRVLRDCGTEGLEQLVEQGRELEVALALSQLIRKEEKG